IMDPVSTGLREEVEQTKSEFLAVLSPEQRQRFDELVKKQHRPHDQHQPTMNPYGTSNPVSPATTPEREIRTFFHRMPWIPSREKGPRLCASRDPVAIGFLPPSPSHGEDRGEARPGESLLCWPRLCSL